MLKIKDSVDLKELEKFGFTQRTWDNIYDGVEFLNELHCPDIIIYGDGRIAPPYTDKGCDILFRLIVLGLVEKVVEE